MDADDLDKKIEQKIDNKIEKKIEQKLNNDQTHQTQNQNNNQKLTRRSFLKTLGLGAGGLALSSLGASNIKITDEGITKDGQPLSPFAPPITGKTLEFNAENELIAKNPSTGNTQPIQVSNLSASGDISATNLEANTSFTDPDGNTYTGKVRLSNEEVQDIIGTILGNGLEYDDTEGIIRKTPTGPNPYDAAQSFTESDLTLTKTKTVVDNGSISLGNGDASRATRPDDDNSALRSGGGVNFVPNVRLTKVEGKISSNCSGLDNADELRIFTSNFSEVASKSISGLSVGDVIGISGISLDAGTEYIFRLSKAGGSRFTAGYSTPENYPYESKNIDIVGDGGERSYSFKWLKGYAPASSGNVILEWERPTYIYEWDVATFTRTLDNETVDVFVAYSSDGSTWTRTNGGKPISRNYSLNGDDNISNSDEVRIEAELSRTNTSNDPTLDSAYRSRFL
jgi:hypothetical protein